MGIPAYGEKRGMEFSWGGDFIPPDWAVNERR
jgi:hypothetical protein